MTLSLLPNYLYLGDILHTTRKSLLYTHAIDLETYFSLCPGFGVGLLQCQISKMSVSLMYFYHQM